MEHIARFYEKCKQSTTGSHVTHEAPLTDEKFKGDNDLRAGRHETIKHEQMQQTSLLAGRVDNLIRDELTFYMPG